MSVKLISVTPEAEKLVAYMARVSSSHQDNPEYARLLKYCIEHGHWSIFEMVHMVVEINTSRAIAAQILRHRSFSYQELSQRYSSAMVQPPRIFGRKQAEKNRQSSADYLNEPEQLAWLDLQHAVYNQAFQAYHEALALGVAKEQARLLLPLATPTRLYMAGSIRSWIHYLQLRTQPDTQQEHREIALAIKHLFIDNLPITSEALAWTPTIRGEASNA